MEVAICTGKSCRKRPEAAELRDALRERCDVVDTRCLGICKGPVLVVDPRGPKPRVLARLRSPKAIRDVRRLAAEDRPPSGRIRDRTVRGGRRARAIARAARSLRPARH